MNYEIVDGTYAHVIELRANLRKEDAYEMASVNTVRRNMARAFKKSLYVKSVISDNKVIAMWGMAGTLLGDEGNPWFLTAPEIEKFPVSMVREGRRVVAEMLEIRPFLQNYIWDGHKKAVKFVSMLGFSLGPPNLVFPNGDLYRRIWMRR